MLYEPRWYRESLADDQLHSFCLQFQETDLWIALGRDAFSVELENRLFSLVRELRQELDDYIAADPQFLHSLVPHQPLPHCPQSAREMASAAAQAGVGPMAAVAGFFSQEIARRLDKSIKLPNLIIENGGDIYLRTSQVRRIAIYAGASPLSNKLALEITPQLSPLGICTSSGTVGHSLSFGQADAVTILSKSTALADAFATAIGNRVKTAADLHPALDYVASCPDILGAVIVIGDKIGCRGDVRLLPICL